MSTKGPEGREGSKKLENSETNDNSQYSGNTESIITTSRDQAMAKFGVPEDQLGEGYGPDITQKIVYLDDIDSLKKAYIEPPVDITEEQAKELIAKFGATQEELKAGLNDGDITSMGTVVL